MSGKMFALITIAIMALVTILIRFLPFWIFRGNRKLPEVVSYLGQVLPYAIMSMLVVYCLKAVDFSEAGHFALPEIISSALVVGLHFWKHNTLVSIICGTVCYMLLVQLVF